MKFSKNLKEGKIIAGNNLPGKKLNQFICPFGIALDV